MGINFKNNNYQNYPKNCTECKSCKSWYGGTTCTEVPITIFGLRKEKDEKEK